MSIYHFSTNSHLSELNIQRSEGGGLRAYASARENADPETLEKIKSALSKGGMQWTPIEHNGKAALEIREIGKNEKKLLEILKKENAYVETPQKAPEKEVKLSLKDKMLKNTLSASGWFYFIGDIGFLSYGWKEAFKNSKLLFTDGFKKGFGKDNLTNLPKLLSGVFYALGTPFIMLFGRGDKSDLQLKNTAYDTIKELEKKGIEIPEDSAIRAMAGGKNNTIGKRIIAFCERYPAEITNSIFALAGGMVFWGAKKDLTALKLDMATQGKSTTHSKSSIFMDMGLGIMTMLAGVISVFVEEEARKPGEPRKTGLAGVWQYIKEKPLRAAGAALGISTISHAGSTVMAFNGVTKVLNNKSSTPLEKTEAKKQIGALVGRSVFVATNLTAEVLMSVSSKGHGNGVKSDNSLEDSTYAMMADLVQSSPPEKRESMLDIIAVHISGRKHLNYDPEAIKQGIRKHLDAMNVNPWAASEKAKIIALDPEQELEKNTAKEKQWSEGFKSQNADKTPGAIIRNIESGASKEAKIAIA